MIGSSLRAKPRVSGFVVALTMAAALLLGAKPAFAASTTCVLNGSELDIVVGDEGSAAVAQDGSGNIIAAAPIGNSIPCAGAPTVDTTSTILVTGGVADTPDTFVVDLEGGPLSGTSGDLQITVSALAAEDTLVVNGGSGVDSVAAGANGINLDAADDDAADVTAASAGAIQFDGNGGADIFSGAGSAGLGSATTTNLTVNGQAGEDTLTAGSGDDTVTGGTEADEIHGGGGTDQIYGGDGDDIEFGDGGSDSFHAESALDGADDIHGGDGVTDDGANDRVLYDPRALDVSLTLDDVANDGEVVANEKDNVHSDIEDLRGGNGNDSFEGTAADEGFLGNGGTDTLSYANAPSGVSVDFVLNLATGGGGEDTIQFDIEAVVGSDFDDFVRVVGGGFFTTFDGEGGSDTISLATVQPSQSGVGCQFVDLPGESVNCSQGDNFAIPTVENIIGTAGNDSFQQEAGEANMIRGGTGVDQVSYSNATTATSITLDNVANDGEVGEGDDIGADIENILAGPYADTIVGSAAANHIDGAAGADVISGRGGDDTLNGNDQNDTIHGGSGNDIIDGGNNDDSLTGGDGDDTVSGGDGNDTLRGGLGDDDLFGDDGNDQFLEGTTTSANGSDLFVGDTGTDTVSYAGRNFDVNVSLDGVGNDGQAGELDSATPGIENITGGTGSDVLTGDANVNVINGLGGNDTIRGGGANDTLNGGDSNDRIVAESTVDGADNITGGNGTDVVDYGARSVAVKVTLENTANDGQSGELDNAHSDIENITGGSANDNLTGTSANNVLSGNGGNDVINAGAGNDILYGGAGNDTLNGVDGNDILQGGLGNDYENGGNGNDQFREENVRNGADNMYGAAGIDTVDYHYRTRGLHIDLDNAADDGDGTEGDNVHNDIENISGGAGSDGITGSSAANRIYGNGGGDVITGGLGADYLDGGAGNDTLYAKDGVKDGVVGGAGTDRARRDSIDSVSGIESFF